LAAENKLFFAADNGAIGRELWKSDGTVEGTVLVRDIRPGVNGSNPQAFAYTAGILYFVTLWVGYWELWKSDGTEAGTARVREFGLATQPYYLDAVEGKVFFVANDDEEGPQLWTSDGTEAGTVILADMPDSGIRYAHDFGTFDGMFFFGNSDGVQGAQLWKSDGTPSGTVPVKNLRSSDSTPYSTRLPKNFIAGDGVLYFAASDGTSGYQLWRSDGTESGTVKIKDVEPIIATYFSDGLAASDGTLFFAARDETHGTELWKSDGTEAGTVLVKDIDPGISGSNPYGFTIVNGTLFLSASDDEHGAELWMSDGTESGTMMVKNIHPGSRGSYVARHTNVEGTLYFIADDGLHGYELWALHPPVGDFDRNHYLNARDVDLLFASVASGGNDPAFDLTGDSLVDGEDVSHLVESILGSRFGDANLDGAVDRADVAVVVRNFGRNDSPGWAGGDFNGDGTVNLLDAMIAQADFAAAVAGAPQSIQATTARTHPAHSNAAADPAVRSELAVATNRRRSTRGAAATRHDSGIAELQDVRSIRRDFHVPAAANARESFAGPARRIARDGQSVISPKSDMTFDGETTRADRSRTVSR
jgi:ELWxxDGT repeat protein